MRGGDPCASVELTQGNNARFQVVDRGRGPYRILYVAGRPNWEHKFLKRALEEDAEIRLASLLRIAKKEPKFSSATIRSTLRIHCFRVSKGYPKKRKSNTTNLYSFASVTLNPINSKVAFPKAPTNYSTIKPSFWTISSLSSFSKSNNFCFADS